MTRGQCRLAIAAALGIVAVHGASPPPGRAVACPSGGATLEVCIKNPTNSVQYVKISGEYVANQNTCHSPTVKIDYSIENVELSLLNGQVNCVPVYNLVSGMWVHHVEAQSGPGFMKQDRRVPVLYAAPWTPLARVDWTYFPSAIRVNLAGDGVADASRCPVNGISNPATCRLRDAIARANQISSPQNPTLIRFWVSPGTMTVSDPLRLEGASNQGHITIDGIEYDGRPWIVGDSNASQDPFYCRVDLNNTTNFRFESDGNTIQGLLIENTVPAPSAQQTKDLITTAAGRKNNLVYAVKIDGGNRRTCPSNNCTGTSDLFSVLGGVSFDQPGLTIKNVEGHSAIDKGVKANAGWVVIEDSWFHHNYRGNVQATLNGKAKALRSVAEKGGRRLCSGNPCSGLGAPDDVIVDNGANGLVANGGTSLLETDANIARLNTNNGIAVRQAGSPVLVAKNDYSCGNHFTGVGVADGGATATGQGIGAVYNGGNGVSVTTTGTVASANFGESTGITHPGNNAFAHNDNSMTPCQFRNNNTSKPVNAQRNQWVNNVGSKCGGGTVNLDTVRNHANDPLDIDASVPTIPSNALLGGQTIRIRGTGFDAIRGNPAPSGGCLKGDGTPSSSCCLTQPPAANVCGTGLHDPLSGKGNCVELCNSAGAWSALAVTAVTPTTIVSSIPHDVFMCTGESGAVHVSKRRDDLQKEEDQRPYCTNVSPKDQV